MRGVVLVGYIALASTLTAAIGCGIAVNDEATETRPGAGGSGGEGGAATPTASSTEDTTSASTSSSGPATTTPVVTCGTGVEVENGPVGSGPCICAPGPGITATDQCGTHTLKEPFKLDVSACLVSEAYADAFECKGTTYSLEVRGCEKVHTSPCLSIGVSHSSSGEDSSAGLWIDGNGDEWKLSDIEMPDALPWSGDTAIGTFTATATRDDGATQKIEGSYEVCILGAVCPI